ncbi:hypothetical protein KEM52_001726 [Ascosphaera acerosa]|nr:hypothetical protein KEM52_001726 [Ascosphaera acerosa]
MLFVTVVVATIGQHLSHRAISLANKRGITIADLTLRNLIIQPGILFTQFRAIRYSAMTMLGLFIFSATLGATFYTTAAEALVSPKLIMGDWHHLNVSTMVHTVFSNLSYIEKHCTVPGYEYFGKTASCVQLGNVGQSYHDYQAWLSNWNQSGPHSEKLSERPPPTGLYLENTTVTGTWLQDPKAWSRYYPEDRLVNSATYAFPHPGVLAAAIDPHNKIRQPSFFGNSSKFSLEATVASPVINVLCAGVSEEELVPLVYANWSGTDFDAGTWQSVVSRPLATELYKEKPGLNKTKVDRLFGWGDSDMEDYRPLFGRFPAPNNTVINVAAKWGFKSTYVLIGVPPELSGAGSSHVLCRARAAMGSGCFTTYHAEASGGKLFTTCDERNRLAYMGPGLQYLDWDPNWVDIAASWTESVSLSTGVMGDPTSNAGVLSHLVSNDTRKPLPRDRPSVAEALAVMAGSTLLSGARNGTISADSWADQIITAPRRHSMTARLQTTILQSGGQVRQWQKALFGSLLIVCLLSLLCCLYLLGELLAQHITDFTEPQNMFALAMNSPPTVRLAGACGVGPDRAQWRQGWKIDLEHRTQHYFIRPSHDVRYSVLEKAAAESGQGLGEALSAGDAETVKGRSSLTDIRPEVTQEFSSLQKRWSILDFFKLSRRKVV